MEVNVCPNCHAVSFGNDGWRYINKYNRTRLCLICNKEICSYKEGWLNDWWIENEKRLHEEWRKANLDMINVVSGGG